MSARILRIMRVAVQFLRYWYQTLARENLKIVRIAVRFLRYWYQELAPKVRVREGCQKRVVFGPCDIISVVLTYVFCCVEIRGGILDSDTAEGSHSSSTDEGSVGFQAESSELEIIELHKLEDMGIFDDDDM
jgi:hypothetical protein